MHNKVVFQTAKTLHRRGVPVAAIQLSGNRIERGGA